MFLILSVTFIASCDFTPQGTTVSLSAYETWRNSENALDMNGDRKINEEDYTLYLDSLLVTTEISTDISITTQSPYEIWKNSDTALDYNDDRRIDEEDYQVYLMLNDYDIWRDSEAAIDLNDDRRINEEDYELYKLHSNYNYWSASVKAEDLNGDGVIDEIDFEIFDNYDFWLISVEAEDLNSDTLIDVLDYEIYMKYKELVGKYYLRNYVYEGNEAYLIQNGAKYCELGAYLGQIIITVENNGEVSAIIPDEALSAFGEGYSTILEALNNISLERISPFIVVMDTVVTIEDTEINITIYLNEEENGFSIRYVVSFYEDDPVITLDIIKAE